MKKFITGFIAGALMFSAIPVFANSLIGSRVEGLYSIQKNDKKIADAIVVNGSTYAPVRAIANATGVNIAVEGKVIILNSKEVDENGNTIGEVPVEVTISKLETERNNVQKDIDRTTKAINNYIEKVIPSSERAVKAAGTEQAKQEFEARLERDQTELERLQSEIPNLQQKLSEIESQLAELQK